MVVLVRLPDVPETVTVTVPVAAVLLAVSFKALELVVLVGLKDAVTPVGKPEADKLTLPLKPFCGVTVMLLEPLDPCVIARLLGDAESVKFGGAATVSEMVVVFDRLPDIPVTVTVTVPVAAVLLAVNINALVPVVLTGLNDAVTPLGKPDADKLTLPLKPPWGATVIVLVPLAPCKTVTLLGELDSEKFGGGGAGMLIETLSKVAVAEAEALPLFTASPTYTFGAMLMVWLVPRCVQFTPSIDV
jgi:hypothetical protein